MSILNILLRHDRIVLLACMAALFALTALYTVFGIGMNMPAFEMTLMRSMRDMPGARAPGDWTAIYATLVFLMWWLMMIAMMLPGVAPTVLLFDAMLGRMAKPENAEARSFAFLAGYLASWAGFSLFAAALQWWLEYSGLVSSTMMALVDTLPGALVLIGAGIYQFTPLKENCLAHCRSPVQFITRHIRPGIWGALRLGVLHGAYCLGCCWILMALLFAGGIMNLFWIVGLTALVAAEKLLPNGQLVARAAGAALIGWGGYTLILTLG